MAAKQQPVKPLIPDIQPEEQTEFVEPKQARLDPLPPKKGRKPAKPKHPKHPPVPADKISQQLYGLHQMACILTKDEAYAITADQADTLGLALYDVCDRYDLWWIFAQTPLITLAVTAVMVEGPVIKHAVQTIRQNQAARKSKQPQSQPQPPAEEAIPTFQDLPFEP